jgi:transcriptional regulator with XRE-family HTH domain
LYNSMSSSLTVVVGRNCKDIRLAARVTQDELARRARVFGLRWNASKVGDFEAGRSAPTFATALVVSLALADALVDAAEKREVPTRDVTLADLMKFDGFVSLTDRFRLPAATVEAVCQGQPWPDVEAPFRARGYKDADEYWRDVGRKAAQESINQALDLKQMLDRSGLTEHRLAKRLEISPDRLAAVSFRLWQYTFSDERDRRAGPDANKQKRGQVSRALLAELEEALADGND